MKAVSWSLEWPCLLDISVTVSFANIDTDTSDFPCFRFAVVFSLQFWQFCLLKVLLVNIIKTFYTQSKHISALGAFTTIAGSVSRCVSFSEWTLQEPLTY